MREVLSIHIGQCGAQIGMACWELYCLEHGIRPDGTLDPNFDISAGGACGERQVPEDDTSFQTFFNYNQSGKYVPRSLFVDLEPTVIDEIRTGTYSKLFHPSRLISGKEDAANNYARGYHYGKDMAEVSHDRLRKIVDECDQFQGFVIFHSYGGGTGSGFTTRFTETLRTDYKKKSIFTFPIYPSPRLASGVVDPYNGVLCTSVGAEHADVSFTFDNEAVYDVCTSHLSIERPTFTNINRLVAQVVSAVTCSLRFEGSLNVDLTEFQTNLVPFPKIHFPLVSYAPVVGVDKVHHEDNNTFEITKQCFDHGNNMVKLPAPVKRKLTNTRLMAVTMLYRGDVLPKDVNAAIRHLKNGEDQSFKFVNWCPTGFKIGINHQPSTVVPGGDLAKVRRSCVMLANSSGICHALERICEKFDRLHQKRAFIHHYINEGMEEGEFQEGREKFEELIMDYAQIVADVPGYETAVEGDNTAEDAGPPIAHSAVPSPPREPSQASASRASASQASAHEATAEAEEDEEEASNNS